MSRLHLGEKGEGDEAIWKGRREENFPLTSSDVTMAQRKLGRSLSARHFYGKKRQKKEGIPCSLCVDRSSIPKKRRGMRQFGRLVTEKGDHFPEGGREAGGSCRLRVKKGEGAKKERACRSPEKRGLRKKNEGPIFSKKEGS